MRTTSLPLLRPLLLAGLLAASSLPALAQATDAEAARLQAVGELYFGKPEAGEAAVVRVVPEADHYRASLDLAVLFRRIVALAPDEEAKKLTFDWAALSVALAPRGDGTWRFWDHRVPKLVVDADGQRTEVVTEGLDFEVVTDPATGATPSMKGRFGRIAATSTIRKPDDPMTVTSESISADVTVDGATRPTGTPGVVDAHVDQTTGSMRYGLDIAGGMAEGVPDMNFALDGGRQDQAIAVKGLRYAALLDLWTHLVAHHAPQDFTTGQDVLKAKLAAALPLFDGASQKLAGSDFAFTSPFGIAKAQKASLDIDLAGLTRDGRVALAVGLDGFQAHSLFMPKWAQKLVPTRLTLAGRVTGYDLATPISVFLESADFTAAKPLTPVQEVMIAGLFLPRGSVDIVVDGNRLAGSLYALSLDGRLTAGPGGAKGALTIRAEGLDRVAEHLATAEGDDQSKALAGMIALARQFAERKGEDHVWRFDLDGDRVAVNGKPLR